MDDLLEAQVDTYLEDLADRHNYLTSVGRVEEAFLVERKAMDIVSLLCEEDCELLTLPHLSPFLHD